MNSYINADLKPLLKKLEVATKKKLPSLGLEGSYMSAFRGGGLEFKDYAVYTPAIDAQKIDWRASLRAGELLTREFEEERNLNVFLLIDTGDSMIFGSGEKLKCEFAAEVAANIGFAILKSDDALGYMIYADKPKRQVVPKIGNRQFFLLTEDLLNVSNYGGVFKFSKAAKAVLSNLKGRSVLIIISDFANLNKEWDASLKGLAAKYDVIGVMIRDLRDKEMPKEKLQVFISDIENNEKQLIETTKIAKHYKHQALKQEEQVRSMFKHLGCDFIELEVGKDFTGKLTKMFKMRSLL